MQQPIYRFDERADQIQSRIEIIELSEERVKFILSDVDISIANALRRSMIAEVPTMAIHFVDIIENSSPLHDEFLSQRLGLIPLVSLQADQKLYDWEVDCDSMDDLKTKAVFTLKQKNLSDVPLDVTSLDLQPEYGQLGDDAIRPVKFFSPVDGREVGIPITRLGKNQSVHVRCHALKGFGKMHAKWTPINIATFKHEPEIIIDQSHQLSQNEKEEVIKSCPVNVLGLDSKTNELRVKALTQCIFCEECVRKVESFKRPRLIKIQHKKNKFIFTVESAGQLRASDIVQRAFQVMRLKLDDISSDLDFAVQ